MVPRRRLTKASGEFSISFTKQLVLLVQPNQSASSKERATLGVEDPTGRNYRMQYRFNFLPTNELLTTQQTSFAPNY